MLKIEENIFKPACYMDENFVCTYSCFFANPIDKEEPSSFDEALVLKIGNVL